MQNSPQTNADQNARLFAAITKDDFSACETIINQASETGLRDEFIANGEKQCLLTALRSRYHDVKTDESRQNRDELLQKHIDLFRQLIDKLHLSPMQKAKHQLRMATTITTLRDKWTLFKDISKFGGSISILTTLTSCFIFPLMAGENSNPIAMLIAFGVVALGPVAIGIALGVVCAICYVDIDSIRLFANACVNIAKGIFQAISGCFAKREPILTSAKFTSSYQTFANPSAITTQAESCDNDGLTSNEAHEFNESNERSALVPKNDQHESLLMPETIVSINADPSTHDFRSFSRK